MSYVPKPSVRHPALPKNAIGLTYRDYEGGLSTLCAGCGHDSVTAAIIDALWELSIPPHQVAKMSGIGCSSKTPGYFASSAHGFNSVHGRMPSVTAGAVVANPRLTYVGLSGDGDTASIGLGQFVHAMRRRLPMVYICENNGAYGLTKGQFSATADTGSLAKGGEANTDQPIDLCALAISMGATFVARGFSGDKTRLVPMLKEAFAHRGFAFLDILSPCVTFNNHVGSTRSYTHIRKHETQMPSDLVPADLAAPGTPGDIPSITSTMAQITKRGDIAMGILHNDRSAKTLPEHLRLGTVPLRDLPLAELCPGGAALAKINARFGWG